MQQVIVVLFPRLLIVHDTKWIELQFKERDLLPKDRRHRKISFEEAKELFAPEVSSYEECDRRRYVRIFSDERVLALVLEGDNADERARTVFGDNCVCSKDEDEFDQYYRVLFAR